MELRPTCMFLDKHDEMVFRKSTLIVFCCSLGLIIHQAIVNAIQWRYWFLLKKKHMESAFPLLFRGQAQVHQLSYCWWAQLLSHQIHYVIDWKVSGVPRSAVLLNYLFCPLSLSQNVFLFKLFWPGMAPFSESLWWLNEWPGLIVVHWPGRGPTQLLCRQSN